MCMARPTPWFAHGPFKGWAGYSGRTALIAPGLLAAYLARELPPAVEAPTRLTRPIS